MSSVFPSGLIAVVTACPTVKAGSNESPGFNAWNDDPGAADGVMCTPVGMKVPFLRTRSSALAETTVPMLIKLKIASASVDTPTRDWQVRPFRNMCYLLFTLQFSGRSRVDPLQRLFSDRLAEVHQVS